MVTAESEKRWRDNALSLTKRYLAEGVPDRAVTRGLPNGVDVPVPGFEGKKIYVWIEAVAGYYTASVEWAKRHGGNVEDWWGREAISYYVHGKDNIPFHTIIWPAILLGIGIPALPTHIISNEYMTLEKKKISTSRDWAVWMPELLERYHPDSVRYFLTMNAPENRDTDFSWREFIYSHNGELLGAFGNFVNRTLKFIEKSFGGKVPQAQIEGTLLNATRALYEETGGLIEQADFKQALEAIFAYVRAANRYFDEQQPWIQITEDAEECERTMATCTFIICNLAQLLQPFLPFAAENIRQMLRVETCSWDVQEQLPVHLNTIHPLYERLDVRLIEEEMEKLSCSGDVLWRKDG